MDRMLGDKLREVEQLLTPKRANKENRARRKPVRSIIANYGEYAAFERHTSSVEAWVFPRRLCLNQLSEFMERCYDMKFRHESESIRKEQKIGFLGDSLSDFVLRTVFSGEKEWRNKPEQFLLNVVYSIEHYQVKLAGIELFKDFLTGRLSNDDFLFFMMCRSIVEKQLAFKTVTETKIADLHTKKVSSREAVKIARLVFEDFGINHADKLSQTLSLKRDQLQITVYGLLHYLVRAFRQDSRQESAHKEPPRSEIVNDLQRSLLSHLQDNIAALVERLCAEESAAQRALLKQSLVPYCMLAVETISGPSESVWFQSLGLHPSERQIAFVQKLRRKYSQLLASGWAQEEAVRLSQEALSLNHWCSILSDEVTKIQFKGVGSVPGEHGPGLQVAASETETQIYRLIDQLLKYGANSTVSKIVKDFAQVISLLQFIKSADLSSAAHEYPQPFSFEQGACSKCIKLTDTLETVKLRLGLPIDSPAEAVLVRSEELRFVEMELESAKKSQLQYEKVVASLREQLDLLLEDRSRSDFSSPARDNFALHNNFCTVEGEEEIDLPMFGRLRACSEDQSSRSFGS